MSGTSLQPSSYLSRAENNTADLHTLDTLTKKFLRLQGMVGTLQDRMLLQDALVDDLQGKVDRLTPQLADVTEEIQKVRIRVLKIDEQLTLPDVNDEQLSQLHKLSKTIAHAQRTVETLTTTPDLDIEKGNELLAQLPREMHVQLRQDVIDFSPKIKKGTPPTLDQAPKLAITLKNKKGVPLLHARIEQLCEVRGVLKDELNPSFVARSRAFTKKVESNEFSHEVLKNLYESLEPETQELIALKPSSYYGRGLNARLHEQRGAIMQADGSVDFNLFAPNARSVTLQLTTIGDEEVDEPVAVEMEKDLATGVWQTTVEDLPEGTRYYYEIEGSDGTVRKKYDPMATGFFRRVGDKELLFDSVVRDSKSFEWNDSHWMKKRASKEPKPTNIYELHPTMWDSEVRNWRDLAPKLAEHCKKFGFTDIELFSVLEHPGNTPFAGYQALGFFAPNSRLGNLDDLKYFIDYLHQENVGIILDWVPAHFAVDSWGLQQFDGTPLFERRNLIATGEEFHEERLERIPDKRDASLSSSLHPDWKTFEFDFSKEPAKDFLYSSADFWLKEMHIDGLRVDAVSSMIYLDYSRKGKEIMLSDRGSKINDDAIDFMRNLNAYVHREFPGARMFAEESTGYKGLTQPVENGGFGFDGSWNMGWMNRTLKGFEQSNFEDIEHGRNLNRGDYSVYELGHDEVRKSKKTLLQKMPGSDLSQFAKTRNLMAYQMCMPGPKLKMMGSEFAQRDAWDSHDRVKMACFEPGVMWEQMKEEGHLEFSLMSMELGRLYREEDALWLTDGQMDSMVGDVVDRRKKVVSYHRRSVDDHRQLLCAHNFSRETHKKHRIILPALPPFDRLVSAKLIFSSNDTRWGGSTDLDAAKIATGRTSTGEAYVDLDLPPNTTVIIEENLA